MADMLSYNTAISGTISEWSALPPPSKMTVNYMQIVTESKRTVGKNALLHKQLLGMKRKLNCTWFFLTPDQYKILEQLHNGHNFFTLRFNNPQAGNPEDASAFKTMVCYGGDISAESFLVDPTTGTAKGYTNVTWNFIER